MPSPPLRPHDCLLNRVSRHTSGPRGRARPGVRPSRRLTRQLAVRQPPAGGGPRRRALHRAWAAWPAWPAAACMACRGCQCCRHAACRACCPALPPPAPSPHLAAEAAPHPPACRAERRPRWWHPSAWHPLPSHRGSDWWLSAPGRQSRSPWPSRPRCRCLCLRLSLGGTSTCPVPPHRLHWPPRPPTDRSAVCLPCCRARPRCQGCCRIPRPSAAAARRRVRAGCCSRAALPWARFCPGQPATKRSCVPPALPQVATQILAVIPILATAFTCQMTVRGRASQQSCAGRGCGSWPRAPSASPAAAHPSPVVQ